MSTTDIGGKEIGDLFHSFTKWPTHGEEETSYPKLE